MAGKRLPDEREAVEGAAAASANAVGLLGDADLLAAAGRCGSALALAVLAFEESVKARSLGAIAAAVAQGRSPGLSDETLRAIVYSSHRARHRAGFLQHLAAAFPETYGKIWLGIAVTPAEVAMLGELAELLGSVDARKQAGFYTDFDPDSGSWSAPDTITDAEFRKFRALVGQYVAETQRQTDDFISFWNAAVMPVPDS